MYLGGSGISCPVPLSVIKIVMSFSTSIFSNDNRIFSQDESSLTQTVEAILAKVQRLLLVKSKRSSSRSWNLSAAAFHSLFHRPVVSSKIFTAASYSVFDVARLICVFSSFALLRRSSWPMTICPWARYPLILRHSCSYLSRVFVYHLASNIFGLHWACPTYLVDLVGLLDFGL